MKQFRMLIMSDLDDRLKEIWAMNCPPETYIKFIKKAFAEEYKFDQHLQEHLPHDGKWRHVEFNVKINKDANIEFKERNVMTGQEWYSRFEIEIWGEDLKSDAQVVQPIIMAAAKRAAGLSDD